MPGFGVSVAGASIALVGTEGTILHADPDAFYASVEQRDDPALRGRPVIVGGGVVLAASYEAKAFGVRTAMGETQARRLCPQAVVVRPRMEAYSEASKAMFEVFNDTTPLVEGLSIDEAFLDVGGLRRIAGTPSEIAAALRRDVRERVGIPITVGVARTKFLAKVASGVAKPDGLLVVPPDGELAFLHALPVERLWGVGPVTARKLHERSHHDGGARWRALDEAALVRILGRAAGRHLHALAHNRDPRRVEAGRRRRSIGTQRALGRRPAHAREARHRSARPGRPARPPPAQGAPCLPHRDAPTAVRRLLPRHSLAHACPRPDGDAATLLTTARLLLVDAMPEIERRGITLIGITFSNLFHDDAVQLALPFDGAGSGAIDTTVDGLIDRFGSNAVTRAALLGRREGLHVPLLPD